MNFRSDSGIQITPTDERRYSDIAGDAAGPEYWNLVWGNLLPLHRYEGPVFEQYAVLSRFLVKAPGREAIEVGCVPGNHMIYLNKEFGYRVDGIDYSNQMDYVRANLLHNEIHDSNLYNEDLFRFVPQTKYDLVLSGGFVEHFDDYESVVCKHAELARPGGLVVIWVPNLTYIHKLLCGLFQPEVLKVHRFPLMRKAVLRRTLEKAGLQVLHCEYNKTFRPTYNLPKPMDLLSRGFQKMLQASGLDNIGNRIGSPYLISVSVKR